MSNLQFQSFHPDLDPTTTVMIDGYAPGFRMISHWPDNGTPEALRHDLTTGSAFLYQEMSDVVRRDLVGDFSVVTNNHYDTDGVLSLFTFLQPDVALAHKDLILRTARAGDFAIWGGSDALALELAIMSDLGPFLPFTTPPFDNERLRNLSGLYFRTFDRLEALLENPFALDGDSMQRFAEVQADIARVEAGEGYALTPYPEDDLAVIETDRPMTTFGLRLAAGNLFRILLVHSSERGNRYRFCFRGESWWDVVSVEPKPRVTLLGLAERLNQLERAKQGTWWAAPPDWTVPELGFGDPVTFRHQAVRFDPKTAYDPPSSLPIDVVVQELINSLRTSESYRPAAESALAANDLAPEERARIP